VLFELSLPPKSKAEQIMKELTDIVSGIQTVAR